MKCRWKIEELENNVARLEYENEDLYKRIEELQEDVDYFNNLSYILMKYLEEVYEKGDENTKKLIRDLFEKYVEECEDLPRLLNKISKDCGYVPYRLDEVLNNIEDEE